MSKYINYVKKILVWVFEINGDTRRYEEIRDNNNENRFEEGIEMSTTVLPFAMLAPFNLYLP